MAMKNRAKVYFPVLDEALAAYQRRTGRTQENIASSLGMTNSTFANKRKGESEFTFTEISLLSDILNMNLDELARDAVITYPIRDRDAAVV